MLIALSTGHSLKDPGAIGADGKTTEFALNNAIVNFLLAAKPLKNALWWQVDKEADQFPYPEYLYKTVAKINELPECAACVEIHHNWVSNKEVRGSVVIYWDSSRQGKALAQQIDSQLDFLPSLPWNIGIKDFWDLKNNKTLWESNPAASVKHIGRRLYYLRKTKVPAIIVEPAFISNKDDLALALNHYQDIARAVANGVDLWLAANGRIGQA